MTRRRVLAALAAVALAAALPVIGRAEGDQALGQERAGLRLARGLVGPSLDNRRLRGYRLAPTFACLIYQHAGDTYGIELCFDSQGRLVEALDRTGSDVRAWTLRYAPHEAEVTDTVAAVVRALRMLGAVGPDPVTAVPVGSADLGPKLVSPPPPEANPPVRPRTRG